MITEPITAPITVPRSPASYPHVTRYGVFAGSSEVSVPDHADFDHTTKLSAGVWLKNDAASLATSEFAFGKWDQDTGTKKEWMFWGSSQDEIRVYLSIDGAANTYSWNPVSHELDAWHHYMFTYDGATTTINFYYDGVLDATGAIVGAVPATMFNSDNPVTIGQDAEGNYGWNGQIRGAVYHPGVAWDAAQRSQVMDTGHISGSAGEWALGHDTLDRSGNGHHGRNTDVTFPVGGYDGRVPYGVFNGSTSLVTVPDNVAMDDGTLIFSTCAWVRNAEATPSSDQTILSKYIASTNNREFSLYYNDANDKLYSTHSADGSTNAGTLSDASHAGHDWSEWTFVGSRFNASTPISWIILNELEASRSTSLPASVHQGTAPFAVGGYGDGLQPWNGDIRAVRIAWGEYWSDDQFAAFRGELKPTTPTLFLPLDRNAQDSSGNDNHGTATDVAFPVNPVRERDQKYGIFNGTAVVTVSDDPAFVWSDELSFGVWAKNDVADITGNNDLISKWAAAQFEFVLRLNSAEKLQFYSSSNGTVSSGPALTDDVVADTDQWHHYCFVYDNPNVTIYVDGVAIPTTGAPSGAGLNNGTEDILLGGTGAANKWVGRMFGATLHASAWTQAQVANIMHTGHIDGAIGEWALEFDALDRSGNGHDGTNTNVTFGP